MVAELVRTVMSLFLLYSKPIEPPPWRLIPVSRAAAIVIASASVLVGSLVE
jgi:hypothetical protein